MICVWMRCRVVASRATILVWTVGRSMSVDTQLFALESTVVRHQHFNWITKVKKTQQRTQAFSLGLNSRVGSHSAVTLWFH